MNKVVLKRIALRGFIGVYLAMGIYTQLGLMETLPVQRFFLADFSIYERAANDVASGKDPYTEKRIGAAFLYPPQSLLFFDAFSHVGNYPLKAGLFMVINLAMLFFMVYGMIKYHKINPSDAWFLFPLAVGFAPFLELLYVGQVNQFVEFGLFLMFSYAGQYPLLAGFGLGWATMLKITPAVFFLYLFSKKQWKSVAWAVGTILFFSLLAWIRYGIHPFFSYVDAARSMLGQFPIGLESHSLIAVINRFMDVHTHESILQTGLNIYLLLIIASGLIGYYTDNTDLFFITLGIGVTLTPNLLWYHHYVFLLLPLFILMCRSGLDSRVVAWCLLGFIITQVDRFYLTAGLLIHIFAHTTIIGLVMYQVRQALDRYRQSRRLTTVSAR